MARIKKISLQAGLSEMQDSQEEGRSKIWESGLIGIWEYGNLWMEATQLTAPKERLKYPQLNRINLMG